MNVDQFLLVIWPILRILTVVKASENIALGKPSDQSSDYGNGWDSSKAVDGCLNVSILSNCCTHTRLGQAEAWWQVDLQTHSAIDTVDIIYREGEDSYVDRLAGYEIYLSDTTDWPSGTRCHKDDTPDLASMSATQNVQCPGVARYLTIYNDRRVKSKEWYSDNAYMELCEVQVYGCPVGRYGNGNCNNDCLNCLGSLCNTTSGVCAGGCKTGFTGLDCRCPVNCRDTTCGNGECTECEDGYFGPFCTACSNGCNDRFCEKVSGNCSVCIAGYHGSSCNQTCPENCNGNSCIKHSGFCTECVPGFYGSTCYRTCSDHCKDNLCIQGNGLCSQCDAGYHGEQCDESCPSNCKDNICNRDDGRCIGCAIEYHGNNCSLKCPDNCMDHTCAQENGECIGCISGFHGRRCLEKCGYCQDGRCEQDTGNCITPCVDGLTGDRCDVRVVVVNFPCHEEGLKMAAIGVSTGCGVVIVVLIIVIIVLVRRQQSMTQQNTTRSTTMTDISLPNIGQDQRTETGNEAIGAQIKEEIKTKMIQTDDKYESLGQSVKEAPAQNIYEII